MNSISPSRTVQRRSKASADDEPAKVDPGVCGCSTPETDRDGDGTPDCSDGCPSDPTVQGEGILPERATKFSDDPRIADLAGDRYERAAALA